MGQHEAVVGEHGDAHRPGDGARPLLVRIRNADQVDPRKVRVLLCVQSPEGARADDAGAQFRM